MDSPSFIDIIVSLVIGGTLGWITGGAWNLLQGRSWNGHPKKK
jgi:hypothetical protein